LASVLVPHLANHCKDGRRHQLWYDDPESTAAKLQVAVAAGIAGFGPYEFRCVAGCCGVGRCRWCTVPQCGCRASFWLWLSWQVTSRVRDDVTVTEGIWYRIPV
jgi:hypothetical protein